MSDTTETRPGLRGSRMVYQAIGLSVALMAPGLGVNMDPPKTATAAGPGPVGTYARRVGEWLSTAAPA